MNPRYRCAIWAVALIAGAHAELGAQDAVNKQAITLPDFNIYAERELPLPESWLYAQIDGFEVLSNASESRTRDMVTELQRYSHALRLVWAGAKGSDEPAALVICGADRKFDDFLPESLRGGERAFTTFNRRSRAFSALVVDEQTRSLSLAMTDVATTTAAPAATESAGSDTDADATEALVDTGFHVDPQQQLLRQYVHYLLAGLRPEPAPWLSEGLAQLCSNLRITETEISLGRVENPNDVAQARTDRDFNVELAHRALMPMAELFAVQPDSATANNPLDSRWAKQCYAFVHWGLYGDLGKNQKNFIRFLLRAEREGTGEKVFQECFKQGYAEMLQTLRVHIESTRSKVAGVRAAPGEKIGWPTPPVVRQATESEIARLKSDVYRLTGQPGKARDALVLAYRRGERDPQLLASLGVTEFEAGQRERARQFLEAAAKGKTTRVAALVALARLRLADRLSRFKSADGRINFDQLAGVLEPLLIARQQSSRSSEVYTLLAEAWGVSATPPPAQHLAVIDEGLKLFPDDDALKAARARLGPSAPSG